MGWLGELPRDFLSSTLKIDTTTEEDSLSIRSRISLSLDVAVSEEDELEEDAE